MVKRGDWKTYDLPSEFEKFSLNVSLTKDIVDKLKEGHLPINEEDKWFSYCESGTLYIHNSETGYCIFIVETIKEFEPLDVIVNRNKEQYVNDDVAEDNLLLFNLLTKVLIK